MSRPGGLVTPAAGSRMSDRLRESWEFGDRAVCWGLGWGPCPLASSYVLRGSRNATHNFVRRAALRHFNQGQGRSLTPPTPLPLRLRLPAAVRGLGGSDHRNSPPPAAVPEGQDGGGAGWFPESPPRTPPPACRWPLGSRRVCRVWLASLVARMSCRWPPASPAAPGSAGTHTPPSSGAKHSICLNLGR